MLKEKCENVKQFVKDHKAEFIAGGLVIGGLIIRHRDLQNINRHLFETLKLIDKDGECLEKLTDIVANHDAILKLNDEELKMICKVIDAQGSLNGTVADAIMKLKDNN